MSTHLMTHAYSFLRIAGIKGERDYTTYYGRLYSPQEQITAAVISDLSNLNLLFLAYRALKLKKDSFAGFITLFTFTGSCMYHTVEYLYAEQVILEER